MTEPQRNSGRTGRRRHTVAEATLAGPKAAYEHRRLYGEPPAMAKLGEAPDWFGAELGDIWVEIVAGAPPGWLTAADAPAVAIYAGAILEYRRLLRWLIARNTPLPAALSRHLRLAGAAVREAARDLSLLPYGRQQITTPPLDEGEDDAAWRDFERQFGPHRSDWFTRTRDPHRPTTGKRRRTAQPS
jgi:hypothetical protein